MRVLISRRLTRWVTQSFPTGTAEGVLAELRGLPSWVAGGQEPERIQASLVIRSGGDWKAFQQQLALVGLDWRDALVGAGLGDEDWRARLDVVLGPEAQAGSQCRRPAEMFGLAVSSLGRMGWPVGRVLSARSSRAGRSSIYGSRCRPPPAIYPCARAGRPRTHTV